MKHLNLLWMSLLLLAFAQCKDDYWESYYSRPQWLEPPVYEVLQNDGRFTSYLRCVDSTMYARILQSASYYTVFAPTDSAFDIYLQEKGYSSVADISNEEADTIVSYSLVYNVYEFSELTDVLTTGWDTLSSLKKKTACYSMIYQERQADSTLLWVVDANSGTGYVVGENNFKYVPTYLTRLFDKRGFVKEDYEYFYPNRTYTGKNIQGATVITEDMYAENGIVHAVDRVNKPLKNLEQLIKDNPNYTSVMKYLDRKDVSGKYVYKEYLLSETATNSFREIYPQLNLREVYVKSYLFPIVFNAERVGYSDKIAETSGYTFVAPTNAAVDSFYKEKIEPYTKAGKNAWNNIDQVPNEIMDYFMYAHVSENLVWPSKYKNAMTYTGEFFNGKGGVGKSFDEENFVEVNVASNGFLYGTDHYIHSKYFETVYTQLLMDSTYSMMHNAMKLYYQYTLMEDLMRCPLNGYDSEYYIMMLPTNKAFENDGYTYAYSEEFGQSVFLNTSASSGDITPEERLKRLMLNGIFVRIKNDQMNSSFDSIFARGMSKTEGDPGYSRCFKEYGFDVMQNYYGDMVRFKCPSGAARQHKVQVQSLGGFDASLTGTQYSVATQLNDMSFSNGVVYNMDLRLLDYCVPATSWNEKSLGQYINDACEKNSSEYSEYKKYVQATLFSYDSDNKSYTNPVEIENTAVVTVLMPNNAAIRQAVEDGYLPTYESITKTDSETYAEDLAKARNFFLYHILNGRVYINDLNPYNVIYSNTTATYQTNATQSTFYSPQGTNVMMVEVSKNDDGNLTFCSSPETSLVGGDSTRVAVVLGATNSNFYARKGVIHGIDGYLPCEPILY